MNYYRKKDEKDDHIPKVGLSSYENKGMLTVFLFSMISVCLSCSNLRTSLLL